MPSSPKTFDSEFIAEVQRESEQNLALCYQCGNCTAGCPVSFAYDYPVNQIMRLVQAGRRQEALSSHAIWLCSSCETCTTRCPNDIDVARIMDVLRHMARRDNIVSEKAVGANYVGKTGRVFTDVDLAPIALRKGKLGLKAHDIKNLAEIRGIFDRYREQKQ